MLILSHWQLWTLYLEQGAGSPSSDVHVSISAILTDFWAKITPAILQLVSHSKVRIMLECFV